MDEETADQEKRQSAIAPEEEHRAEKRGQEEHRVELEAQQCGQQHQAVEEVEGKHIAPEATGQDVREEAGQRRQVGWGQGSGGRAAQGQVDEHKQSEGEGNNGLEPAAWLAQEGGVNEDQVEDEDGGGKDEGGVVGEAEGEGEGEEDEVAVVGGLRVCCVMRD